MSPLSSSHCHPSEQPTRRAAAPAPKARSKPRGGPAALTKRMLTMIHLMVHGHPNDSTHTLYGLYDAAKAVGYRRKAARHLAGSELFAEAYWAARAGEDISCRAPTFEEVRRAALRQDAARQRREGQSSAGYIIRLKSQAEVAK